jgi:hypothetical protein
MSPCVLDGLFEQKNLAHQRRKRSSILRTAKGQVRRALEAG